ncbi:MAG: hypothetical protein B6241_14355 [Spirochaetaceae bacterium 4572_59]|nr:MAG: hypothetical protein B6241_14355 [Spirochaetaceae bacterium 4572_59]
MINYDKAIEAFKPYTDKMKLKLIACEVITREVCWCVARTPHTVDMVFTPKGAHESGDLLRKTIQEEIDKTDQYSLVEYDAILLGYGLCGNGTAGLSSKRYPLVIPRAHDCCTLFLGSRNRFKELFEDNPSRPYSSGGYMERGDSYLNESNMGASLGLDKSYEDYLELYGEENAHYIMESIESSEKDACKELYFIDIPETSNPEKRKILLKEAESEGYDVTVQQGSLNLIQNLLGGQWNDDYQIIPPGEKSVPLYDWDRVMGSTKSAN